MLRVQGTGLPVMSVGPGTGELVKPPVWLHPQTVRESCINVCGHPARMCKLGSPLQARATTRAPVRLRGCGLGKETWRRAPSRGRAVVLWPFGQKTWDSRYSEVTWTPNVHIPSPCRFPSCAEDTCRGGSAALTLWNSTRLYTYNSRIFLYMLYFDKILMEDK